MANTPRNIWTYFTRPFACAESVWVVMNPELKDKSKFEQYTNTEMLIKELEGMRDDWQKLEKPTDGYIRGFNAAIDEAIKKVRGDGRVI